MHYYHDFLLNYKRGHAIYPIIDLLLFYIHSASFLLAKISDTSATDTALHGKTYEIIFANVICVQILVGLLEYIFVIKIFNILNIIGLL